MNYQLLSNKAIIRNTAISLFCTLNEVDWNPDDIDLVNRFENWFIRVTTNEPFMKHVGYQYRVLQGEKGVHQSPRWWNCTEEHIKEIRDNGTVSGCRAEMRAVYAYD